MEVRLDNLRVRIWLAIVGSATLVVGGAYAMVQQSTRLAADDAPLAAAQAARQSLDTGTNPKDVIPAATVNLRSDDTGVFVIVTDNNRSILASSALLDNGTPLPPRGVFDYTKSKGTDHFTWEPTAGVRLAARVLPYNNGFVVTGQSLKQAEDRTGTYGLLALAAWLATIGWATITLLLPRPLHKLTHPKE